MHSLVQDFRFTFRLVRRHAGTSVLVIAALVLGIGVNTAVFSVVNSVLLKPLQIADPQRVALVIAKSPDSTFRSVSYPEYQDWKAQSHSFQDMAAYQPTLLNLELNGHAEGLFGFKVTASAFDTFGIVPLLGRPFLASDERRGASPVAVISNGLWKRSFGADPTVIGKTIVLQSQAHSIVGVFPETDFPNIRDVWVEVGPSLDDKIMNRESRSFYVAARLKSSSNLREAQQEMDVIAARLAAQYPKDNKGTGVTVAGLMDRITSPVRRPLALLVLASALILLLALVNVLSVSIASAIERRKELSVRLALGATRFVILRQLFIQSLLFGILGTALGFVAAKVGLTYLIRSFPLAVTRFQETKMDHTVLAFTIGIAIASIILSSLIPGLYITPLRINSELKDERLWAPLFRYPQYGSSALIVFEVALAVGLSLVSGLLIKSFYEIQKIDLGFNPRNILCFEVWPPQTRFKDDATKTAFYERAVDNLKAIPGIRSASAGYTLPAVTGTHSINLQVDSQSPLASERPFVDANSVTPEFLTTLKAAILQGRNFGVHDSAGAPPVAIVDEVLAARMWPGQSALGKRLRVADISDGRPPWREVVGVVRRVKYYGPEKDLDRPQVYEPLSQDPPPVISFVFETSAAIETLRPAVEKAIQDLAPDLPIQYFQPMDDFVEQQESRRRISLILLSGFAVIGVVVGMIGIYAVVSNSVVRRRREIAIRMALGATVANALLVVTRVVISAAIVGIAVGMLLVASLKGVLSAFLFGVKPLDPQIFFLTAIAVFVLAVIAGLFPAARLLRLTPQNILRE